MGSVRPAPTFFAAIVHPSAINALRLTPREKWKMAYRSERMACRGVSSPLVIAALGSVDGVRFIEREPE